MEWLGKDHSATPQIEQIRTKLSKALTAAQELDNPMQDYMDDEEVDALLANNPEYIEEMNYIKRNKSSDKTTANDE